MDAPVEGEHKKRWLILIYHLPREPSRHRVAVWRKLKALGPSICRTGRPRCPMMPLPASNWSGCSALREAAYRELIDSAGKLKRKAAIGAGGTVLLEELARIERDFRTERRRDYFRSPLRKVADAAIREARRVVKEGAGLAVREDAG